MIINITSKIYGDSNGLSDTQNDGSNFTRSSSFAPWRVTVAYETDEPLEGSVIYFNPYVHCPVGTSEFGVPARGWKYKVPVSLPTGIVAMIPHNLGSYAPQLQAAEVVISVLDSNTFVIVHSFYHWWDLGGMYPNVSKDAYDILFKNHQSAPIQFSNSFSSVYNSLKDYYSHVYVAAASGYTDGEVDFRFKVQDLYFNMLKPGWVSSQALSRLSGPVSNLSAFEKTKVTFQLTRPSGSSHTAPEAYMYLFRGDPGLPTNAQPVWTDVAAEIHPMANNPATGSVYGNIYGPIVEPFLTGDVWEASFYIGGVIPGERYYAAILWYIHPDDGTSDTWYTVTLINTSENPYIVEGDPEALPVTITTEFDDLKKTISANNPIYAPVQRHKFRTKFLKATYDAAAVLAGAPFTDTSTDLTNIKVLINGGSPQTAFKTGTGWITSHPRLTITEDATYVIVEYDFRGLYGFGYPDWMGTEVTMSTTFHFDYATLPSFKVEYFIEDKFKIDLLQTTPSAHEFIESIKLYSAVTGQALRNICGDEDILVEVKLAGAFIQDAADYFFSAYVDKYPHGVGLLNDAGLKEEETFVPLSVPQLLQPLIYDCSTTFNVLGFAFFKINASLLEEGVQYYAYGGATKR